MFDYKSSCSTKIECVSMARSSRSRSQEMKQSNLQDQTRYQHHSTTVMDLSAFVAKKLLRV